MAIESQRANGDRQFTAPGVEVTVLASEEETHGAWSLFEYAAEPGFQGPPPH